MHALPRRPSLRRALVLPLAFCLAASCCACSPGSNLHPIPAYNPTTYRLGPGDQVRVITYGDEQLTDDFRVSENGTLALPLLGAVPAQGLTADELAGEIAQRLEQKKLLRSASVTVEVTAYRPVAVLGEVARPGEYPYHPGMTMLSAVAAAGGFTYRAVESRAKVIRKEGNKLVAGRLTPEDYVAPGDVIDVYMRVF